jgi:DNA helicase-2/ATP-dependent DNA helicase PcrA
MNIDYSLLNPEQLAAVNSQAKELLIIAGAGSGKTRTLTYRIAKYLEESRCLPYEILAFCFTKKSSDELKERVYGLLGNDSIGVEVSTHHSVCFKILRKEAKKLGYRDNFSIFDAYDSTSLVKRILKELDYPKIKPNQILNIISVAKNNLVSPENFEKNHNKTDELESIAAKVYPKYANALKKGNCMDFDDALYNLVQLLRSDEDVRQHYHNRYKHIFVDEYQDTNTAQYEIIRLLHNDIYKNEKPLLHTLTVVGDANQSIYSFRGSTIRNIEDFDNDFPYSETIYLNKNYRSTQEILNVANKIIAGDSAYDKGLESNDKNGDRPKFLTYNSDLTEARKVVEKVGNLIKDGVSPSEIAIFYRINSMSANIEKYLLEKNIEYRVFGGMKFFERKEIKDIAAYLNFIVNPNNNEALLRIINVPARGIGDSSQNVLLFNASANFMSINEYARSGMFLDDFKSKAMKIEPFFTMMDDLRSYCEKATTVTDCLNEVLTATKYLASLDPKQDKKDESRIDNINQFVNFAKLYDKEHHHGSTLSEFVESISLYTDVEDEVDEATAIIEGSVVPEQKPTVSLMTLHSSKGLEFDYVYLLGMEDEMLPFALAKNSEAELAEEKRLFYVGVTRARKELELSMSVVRFRFGRPQPCIKSPFIDPVLSELNIVEPIGNNYRTWGGGSSNYHASKPIGAPTTAFSSQSAPRFSASRSSVPRPSIGKSVGSKPKPKSIADNFKQQFTSNETYDIGDMISHTSYGLGEVIDIVRNAKGDILKIKFSNNEKNLISTSSNFEKL